jgi:hypothetical protein
MAEQALELISRPQAHSGSEDADYDRVDYDEEDLEDQEEHGIDFSRLRWSGDRRIPLLKQLGSLDIVGFI